MFRSRFVVLRVIFAVLLIGGLVAAGTMLYRSGQAQGYALGLAASGNAVQQLPGPVMPYYPGYFYPGHFFFFPLFGLLFWGFLIIFVFGRIGHHRHWREEGMHPMEGHQHPWGKEGPPEPEKGNAPGQPKEPSKDE